MSNISLRISEGALTVLYRFDKASKDEILAFEEKIRTAAAHIPTARVTQQKALSGVLFANVSTSYSLREAAGFVDELRNQLSASGLKGSLVTGPAAIYHDVTPVLGSDLHRGQLIAIGFTLYFSYFYSGSLGQF
ncbi:MAG: hypothetical protein WDO06_02480 [Actinomycetota bacterium]